MSSGTPSQAAARHLGIIIVAGGSGERLGYGIAKAQVPLAGEAILSHALRGVIASGVAQEIVVVIPPGNDVLADLCASASGSGQVEPGQVKPGQVKVVDGGNSRAESVRAGLAAISADIQLILVHDAARALTPPDVFDRVARALEQGAEAVIPAIPIVDTVKTVARAAAPAEADSTHPAAEFVTGTPDRSLLRSVQTPQGFAAETLRRAHQAAELFDGGQQAAITDDAMLVENLNVPVFVVPGSVRALKITSRLDLMLAEALLAGEYPHRIMEG